MGLVELSDEQRIAEDGPTYSSLRYTLCRNTKYRQNFGQDPCELVRQCRARWEFGIDLEVLKKTLDSLNEFDKYTVVCHSILRSLPEMEFSQLRTARKLTIRRIAIPEKMSLIGWNC